MEYDNENEDTLSRQQYIPYDNTIEEENFENDLAVADVMNG